MTTDVHELARLLRSYRFSYADEDELQQAIAGALTAEGWAHEREYRLPGTGGRIDFLVDGPTSGARIGVEVKIKGSVGDVERQVRRYVASGQFDSVLLVTTSYRQGLALACDIDGVVVAVLGR